MMEYQISLPITSLFYKKYMFTFPYLNVLNKSHWGKDEKNIYIIDIEVEISYYLLENIDSIYNVYYSCIKLNDDNYRCFFHSKDFDILDKLCREAVKYFNEEKKENNGRMEMYQ